VGLKSIYTRKLHRTFPMRIPRPAFVFVALLPLLGLTLEPQPAPGQETPADAASEKGPSWPLEVVLGDYFVVLYQPQPESFSGNLLEGRFVLSASEVGEEGEPVFGTAWFEARVDTDRDNRTVTIRDVEVIRVHFPDIQPEQASRAAAALTEWMTGQEIETSLDEFLTTIALAERRDLAVEGLSMEPPEILYRNTPAVLVIIDGDPILERIQDSDVMDPLRHAAIPILSLRRGGPLVSERRCHRALGVHRDGPFGNPGHDSPARRRSPGPAPDGSREPAGRAR